MFLNRNPPKEWIKNHPFVKNHKYLPIDKVEYLLKKFFKSYKIEILNYGQLFNSVQCHVRVHYVDIVSGEWMYHDGVGAQDLQTASGTGSLKMDMSNVQRGAVSMALPIAKTLALKDACDHLGTVFGANLNRKDTFNYEFDKNLIVKGDQKEDQVKDEEPPNLIEEAESEDVIRLKKVLSKYTKIEQVEEMRSKLKAKQKKEFKLYFDNAVNRIKDATPNN